MSPSTRAGSYVPQPTGYLAFHPAPFPPNDLDMSPALHKDLEQAIGSESAGNLMSHLPPVGWADLATKRDLDALRTELRSEMRGGFGELRGELGELRGEIHQAMNAQTKALFVSLTSVMLTLAALGFAALQLT